jgi:hypothetical protein
VSPLSLTVSSGRSTTNISVSTTNGCAWTATSNAPWLSIDSGASGTGAGTVVVGINRNNGGARVGTLTIAAQTVTITQNAQAGGD